MGVIDFKEIPSSKGGEPGQDSWEFFARDFFSALSLEIGGGPDRGPDSGRDLIVREERAGRIGRSVHTWLVSCKHFAHSGKAVSDRDEVDPLGRVRKFNADGFIGFYSTIPSSSLAETLRRLEEQMNVRLYDSALIEQSLMKNRGLEGVFKRYLPHSFQRWEREDKSPATLYDSYVPLSCVTCGKDLLEERTGIVVIVRQWKGEDRGKIVNLYWACKGECDRRLEGDYVARGYLTGWEDISDLAIPVVFMRWIMGHMNRMRAGEDVYADEAFEKLKEFTLAMAQVVVREESEAETKRVVPGDNRPSWLLLP